MDFGIDPVGMDRDFMEELLASEQLKLYKSLKPVDSFGEFVRREYHHLLVHVNKVLIAENMPPLEWTKDVLEMRKRLQHVYKSLGLRLLQFHGSGKMRIPFYASKILITKKIIVDKEAIRYVMVNSPEVCRDYLKSLVDVPLEDMRKYLEKVYIKQRKAKRKDHLPFSMTSNLGYKLEKTLLALDKGKLTDEQLAGNFGFGRGKKACKPNQHLEGGSLF
jgi:hypothetical protein